MNARWIRSLVPSGRRAVLAAAALAVLLGLAADAGAVPGTINYQGMLVENGVPVDGVKSVRFRIYDSASGGNSLWTEVQSITVNHGLFSVLLGSTEAIPENVFSGPRRWLAVSIAEGAEITPRGEIASVGYAFRSAGADAAAGADKLDGYDASQFAGAAHTHDSRYYTQAQLTNSDGTPPNQGSNAVNWNNLGGVPAGFADGVDDAGSGGVTDHGALTGLLDNDHPQYARWDSLKADDGTPPNVGSNILSWDNLTGVPAGFADGRDSITTNASLIVSGTMSPSRIQGTAVITTDSRLLTTAQKAELTGGGVTTLHSHPNPDSGDISSVTAGEGISGGGLSGDVTISHAADASSLPFAHHLAPRVAYAEADSFRSGAFGIMVIDSLVLDAPADGFVYISFSGTQLLDIAVSPGFPIRWVARRYLANYGVAIDAADSYDYHVTSSMQDTVFVAGIYVPSQPVAGSVVRPIAAGPHTIYLLTDSLPLDDEAENRFARPSLVAMFLPFDQATYPATQLGNAGGGSNQRSGGVGQ